VPKYMLLLYDDPSTFKSMSPEDMQKVVEKYMAWGARLRQAGLMSHSNKLADDAGKVMRGGAGDLRVTDGPYSETKEVLGGYFVIEAPSYDKAVEFSRDCPHIEYGGTIEVRQVDTMGQ
jgi:hypothetical protein